MERRRFDLLLCKPFADYPRYTFTYDLQTIPMSIKPTFLMKKTCTVQCKSCDSVKKSDINDLLYTLLKKIWEKE